MERMAQSSQGLGTNLYSLGVPPKVIQETLRHADVTTTEPHYIVVDRSETAKAMKKLERAVGKEWAKSTSEFQCKCIRFNSGGVAQMVRATDS
jgi:hypothetical protein